MFILKISCGHAVAYAHHVVPLVSHFMLQESMILKAKILYRIIKEKFKKKEYFQ